MLELTKPQKLIYDMEKFAGGSIATVCGSIVIKGKKDITKLSNAVNELYRLNDALRIIITETDGVPYQTIKEYNKQEINVLRFKNKTELNNYAENFAKEPMDFYGSLCHTQIVVLDDAYGLLVKLHHIISDAWTLALIGSQFNSILKGELPETYSYLDYISSEQKYLGGKRYQKDKDYYIEQFKKCDETTYLSDKQVNSYVAERKTFVVDKEKTTKIAVYANDNNASVFMLLMTALGVYINRIKMNQEKFYVGTAVVNRNGLAEQKTMGMFINTVPVLFDLENNSTFKENLDKFSENMMTTLRRQKFNYGDVLKELRSEFNFSGNLYDVMLSYQNAKVVGLEDDFESIWYHCGMQTESLQMHIDDRDSEGILKIHYDYQVGKFTETEIERMHEHIFNLLFDAIHEDKKITELNILSEEEKKTLLYDFNDTKAYYPKDKCVHQLFEEQVLKTPDKTAVIACDKTLTYDELNKLSNRIANRLIEKGVEPNDIVAFALPRTSMLIAAMFGILKSGSAYMPIDPDYPKDRIDYMLEDSHAKFLITESNLDAFISDNKENPQVKMTSNNYCYCIYTSGSTGKPKGTLLQHNNVVNYVNENNYNFRDTIIHNDYNNILSVTTVGFDIFVTESIMTLLSGKTMLFASGQQTNSQAEINKFGTRYAAEVLQTTPTKMQMLSEDAKHIDYIRNLKAIMLGGESVPDDLCTKLKNITHAEIFNVYGPTETTVWSTFSKVSNSDITIGKPIANTQVYIVDKYNNLVPIGVTGELCIAGDGVGAGYLNRPELTAEKFIDNPFGEGKMYKTGDLAYRREDGNIAYVGRNDFQVKIRGLRIELGEIENAIDSVEGVSQAVVVVRKDTTSRQLICAFYTEQSQVDIADIKSAIASKLPKYMMPHIFTSISEMPLTSSGKINRKALPEVDLTNIANDVEFVKPQSELQKELAKLMEKVLNYSPIGLNDDFFTLGGDSLKAIEFVSKAHSEGIYFNLQAVFNHPTVAKLYDYIENADKQAVSYAQADFDKFTPLLENNNLDCIEMPQKNVIGNVFVTGSTGFLGSHIIHALLERSVPKIYCLVRNDENRLYDTLSFYFGDTYKEDSRIIPIVGDLEQLADMKLNDTIDLVIHTAASVKHYGSYQYFYDMNVLGTKTTIEFAKKHHAKMIHVSTLSVSGNSLADDFDVYKSDEEKHFYEDTLYIGQPLDNVYIRSKFEAEKAVLDAMLSGLKANIIRVGNLTNRSIDLKFQKNYKSNAFLTRVKSVLEFGYFPDYLMHLYAEFSPVDDTAKAIVTIAEHFNNKFTVFNANNHKNLYFDKMFKLLEKLGITMHILDADSFIRKLKNPEMQYVYEALVNDMDENGKLIYDSNIKIHNEFTVEYLKTLGFAWSDIDFAYMKGYVEYFRKIKYLNV